MARSGQTSALVAGAIENVDLFAVPSLAEKVFGQLRKKYFLDHDLRRVSHIVDRSGKPIGAMRSVDIHGVRFQVEPEPDDYWNWIEQGLYHADFSTIKRFASPEVTCIDAGAWVGAQTLYGSKMFKHVHAIEPDPVAYQILRSNVNANHLRGLPTTETYDNVTLYECALAGRTGETTIGSTILGCSCTRESCQLNAVTVSSVTLREFAKNIPDPLFIKMDVEGAESHILQDWEFFAERKPDLMLSTHLDWWKEGGSDGYAEYAAITKVGKLYRNAINYCAGDTRTDLTSQYGDVVFTDKEWHA